MKTHNLTVDIYASYSDIPPRYRIYVDNNLLTERDFIWTPHDYYVQENIFVNLEPGVHTIAIEQVGNNGIIRSKNIRLDGETTLPVFSTTE